MDYFKSDLSEKEYPENERVNLASVRTSILQLIKQEHPELDESMNISRDELDEFRRKYLESYLKDEFENTSFQPDIIEQLKNDAIISVDVDKESDLNLTFGQRIADKVADFGGSWKFIICFLGFMCLWICLNVYSLFFKPFDAYPFILLNLILSCLAALQAPVIMMSQNRVEDRDRLRAKEDYKVNLKSEIEIKDLHEKFDHHIFNQQQKMFEVQEMQVAMLKEIAETLSELKANNRKQDLE